MTIKILAALALCIPPALAVYTYDHTEGPTYQTSNYYNNPQNYINNLNFTANGVTSNDVNGYGGSLIWNNTTLGSNYEVKMTLSLASTAGVYISYLRADQYSRSGPGISGTFYSVEIQNPTFSSTGCSATLIIVKSVNGVFTIPVSTTVPCHNGMTVRSVYTSGSGINVYIDNVWYTQWVDNTSPILSGQPGFGVRGSPTNNYISSVSFGHLDTVAPGTIDLHQLSSATFSTLPISA